MKHPPVDRPMIFLLQQESRSPGTIARPPAFCALSILVLPLTSACTGGGVRPWASDEGLGDQNGRHVISRLRVSCHYDRREHAPSARIIFTTPKMLHPLRLSSARRRRPTKNKCRFRRFKKGATAGRRGGSPPGGRLAKRTTGSIDDTLSTRAGRLGA